MPQPPLGGWRFQISASPMVKRARFEDRFGLPLYDSGGTVGRNDEHERRCLPDAGAKAKGATPMMQGRQPRNPFWAITAFAEQAPERLTKGVCGCFERLFARKLVLWVLEECERHGTNPVSFRARIGRTTSNALNRHYAKPHCCWKKTATHKRALCHP